MTISILTDNHAGHHTPAEHGLSYLIEHQGYKVLFDTGQSDLFMRNADLMGKDINDTDYIVLSHGHYDHGNGLGFLSGGKLICHPGCFTKRFSRRGDRNIGLNNTLEEIAARFDLTLSSEPKEIVKDIFFLGEIPRLTDFESKKTSFAFSNGDPDYVTDDSALAIKLNDGLFIVSGCGHSGIVNIMEHARKVSGIDRIYGIAGGFHLQEADQKLKETISYLQENKVKHVLPSHCTELPALSVFHSVFGSRQIKTGDTLTFRDDEIHFSGLY